jgi:hypothetical protein
MKPTVEARLYLRMSISGVPGGSVGCTSTGRPRRSISCQIGAKAASVSERPATLANTMTPTAPALQARSSSPSAWSGYSQGSDAIQRMRPGCPAWPSAMLSFMIRAAFRLTSAPPQ